MNTPRVSVIIPTYNRVQPVCEAIESVLAQTFSDFELLVVDDGSSDDTAEVIAQRYGGEPRLRYLPKENGGTGSARAHGLEHARAPLIALLDSDDRYLPRFLESQVGFVDARPGVDWALCDARYEGPWDGGHETVFSNPDWRTPDRLGPMVYGAWALPSATVIRAEPARRIGFKSEFHWSEDTDFLWRFLIGGFRLEQNPEVLTLYLRHAGEVGAEQKIENTLPMDEERLQMLERYATHLPQSRDLTCAIHRLKAEQHLRSGDRRAARNRFWRWWCAKPDSSKALKGLLRTLLPFG